MFFGKDSLGIFHIQAKKFFTSPEGARLQREFAESISGQQEKIPNDTKMHCAQVEGHDPVMYDMSDWDNTRSATARETKAMAQHFGLEYADPDLDADE